MEEQTFAAIPRMVVIGHKLTSVDHLETRSSPLALMTGSALADIRSFTSAFAASGSLAVAINFALIPARYFAPQALGIANPGLFDYLPFFSNMFLHGGWLHLILNMWTLWVFGPAIEDRLGRGRYLAFYLGCGVLASVTHAAFNPTSLAPALGVSGAIAGVLGCYLRLFPYSRVIVLVPILFVPLFFDLYAVVFIGIWIAVQVLQGVTELVTPATGEGIAWWAHIGGFAGGLVFGGLLKAPASRYRAYYGDEGVLGFTPGGMR